jgi:hypothetical protein
MAYFYVLQFVLRPSRVVALLRSLVKKRPHTYFQRMVIRRVADAGSAAPAMSAAALGRVADEVV